MLILSNQFTTLRARNNEMRVKDFTGLKYGRLTVIEFTGKRAKNGHKIWRCKCDCGNICDVQSSNLTSGNTLSCGCVQRERSSQNLSHLLLVELRGEKHPRWRKDLTDEERILNRNTPQNREFREAVYKRDNYICQCCGYDKGKCLNAHHKNSWNTHKDLRYDINNGTTLCDKCHRLFHKIYGYNDNTETQFGEFIANFKAKE